MNRAALVLTLAKLGVGVAAGGLAAWGKLSPELTEVLSVLVGALGASSVAHAVQGIFTQSTVTVATAADATPTTPAQSVVATSHPPPPGAP